MSEDSFSVALHLYSLDCLKNFYNACQTCLDVLIEQGCGETSSYLYDSLYAPWKRKLNFIQEEIDLRESEVATITEGLKKGLLDIISEVHEDLDFQNFVGENLWLEFCAYRREDTYKNENYISDGLTDAELVSNANAFINTAKDEVFKAAHIKYSISASLSNLLIIPAFSCLVDSFEVGNWLRIMVDGVVHRLRLVSYSISGGSLENLTVEFSEVEEIHNGSSDLRSLIGKMSSISSSYDYVARQASNGAEADKQISDWLDEGLTSALVQIKNNKNEEITYDSHGLLARSYDDITETYSPEQFKMTHNILAYTTDNWETVSAALGKHDYVKWEDDQWVEDTDYGLSAKFVTAGYVTGSQIIGGEIVSSNYSPGKSGTYFDLINGDFEIAGGRISYNKSEGDLLLKNVTINWDTSNSPEVSDISGLSDYLDQLDGRIQTYSQTEDPSKGWTSAEKKEHIGDIWTNPDDGLTKIWNGTSWEIVTDSVLKELAESKAQIFTSKPTPPYYVGDLWVQGSNGDIMNCATPRTSSEKYNEGDWVKSSKYTDDTVAKEALEKAKQGISDAASAISLANNAQTIANDNATAISTINNSDTGILAQAKSYTNTQDKSLSDTLTEAYEEYADSKVSELDSYAAKYLGLGGGTLIGTNYIVSPLIEGGYLNITNTDNKSRVIIDPNNLTKNGYIFQVHNGTQVSVGIDKSGNASFMGEITATSLTLGSGVSIDSTKISGLSAVATSGSYSDLTNKPTIPSSVSDLGLDTSKIIFKGDIKQTAKTDSNGLSYVETTVPSSDGKTISYSTYDANDYIVFGRSKGTNSSGENYVCISKDGLLTARNALIYGTVYATDGEFSGKISTSTLEADSIRANGALNIYSSGSSEDLAGFIGYKTGLSKDGTDTTVTEGICISNSKANSYFIVTDAGARMSSNAASIYVSEGNLAVIKTTGNVSISGSSVKINNYEAIHAGNYKNYPAVFA